MFKRIFILLAFAAAGLPARTAASGEVISRTDYTIALAGLPLANARFQTRRNERVYAIEAQIASTGIGDFLADTKAEMFSAGEIRDGHFHPEHFRFRYRYGKRTRSFETRFESGNVISSIIEPKRKKRKGWIAVRPEDLRAVTDPVAGLVMPAGTAPCRGRIPVYDGEARLDLKLAHKGEESFRTEGFEGPAIVCSLRYEPKSGYRRGHRDLEYVRKLKTMEIWFAKSTSMNVYAPVFLSIPTKYGTLTITATHFEG